MADRAWEYGSIVGPYEFSAQIDMVEAADIRFPLKCVRVRRDGSAELFNFSVGYAELGDAVGVDQFKVNDLDEFINDLIELRKFARAHFIANDVRKGRE